MTWSETKQSAIIQTRACIVNYLIAEFDRIQLPSNTEFLRVFTGTHRGLPWSDEQHGRRPHAGFRTLAPDQYDEEETQQWLQSSVSSRAAFSATCTQLVQELLPINTEESIVRALFPIQILGCTRTLTGQRDRRTVLHVIRDTLVYRLINKDVASFFRARRHQPNWTRNYSIVKLLRTSLGKADQASVWSPSLVAKHYHDALQLCDDPSRKINIAALSGSWTSPVIAALDDAELAERIESILIVDVIQEYRDVVDDVLQPNAPFHIDVQLDGSERVASSKNYDLVIWNPPYWGHEQYDMRDAAFDNDKNGCDLHTINTSNQQ